MGQFEDFLEYDSSKMNYSPPPYVISHRWSRVAAVLFPKKNWACTCAPVGHWRYHGEGRCARAGARVRGPDQAGERAQLRSARHSYLWVIVKKVNCDCRRQTFKIQ